MLHITTWLWGDKYSGDYLAKLIAGVHRNLRQPHRFVAFIDEGVKEYSGRDYTKMPIIFRPDLTKTRGCFVRLQMFSPEWQEIAGIAPGERIVMMDLDTVVTDNLDTLFDRPEPFVILQGGNAANPCPFNGALQMLRAGAYPEVWNDFSLEAASKVPFYEFPDDQGWIWHKIPNAAGWVCGKSGAYVFRKPGWPGYINPTNYFGDDQLPPNARLVTFSGWRSPKTFEKLPWIRKHWRE